jgi:hypothetical protein
MTATAAMADSFIFPPVHSVIKATRGLNLDTFAGNRPPLFGQSIDDY